MEVRERLMKLADGLLFITEFEAPITYISAPAEPGAVDVDTIRAAFGEGDLHREDDVDHFFSGHTDDADPADPVAQANVPRFRALIAELKAGVDGPRVFCFGETSEKRCYAVGRIEGGFAGLKTVSYET